MPKKHPKKYWFKYRWVKYPESPWNWPFTNRYKTKKAAIEGMKNISKKGHYEILDSNLKE